MHRWLAVLVALLFGPAAVAAERWVNVPAAQLRGQPAPADTAQDAFLIWMDGTGLHLRWKAGGQPRLFTGRLDANAPILQVTRVDEKAGGWARTHGPQRLLFSATARAGGMDGVDLSLPKASRADLLVDVDGAAPTPEQIFLGAEGAHPARLPLRLLLK